MRKRLLETFSLVFFVVLIDQVTKFLVVGKNFFPYFVNKGVIFGLFFLEGYSWLFLLMWVVVLVYLFADVLNEEEWFGKRFALGLLVGGGLSNLIDRVRYGGVVDFLFLGIGPRFNMADLLIVLGLGVLVYKTLIPVKLWEFINSNS